MKTLIALLVITSALHAQNSLSFGAFPTTIDPRTAPATVTVPVLYTGTVSPAGLFLKLTPPAGVSVVPSLGAQATAANKNITCNMAAGVLSCVLVGFNATVMLNGEVAKFTLTFPAKYKPGASALTLSGPQGATPTGTLMLVGVSQPVLIAVLSSYDLNADGKVTQADQDLSNDQVIGKTPCTADVDGDGICTVADSQLIANNPL